ncbi:MAG: hypothetical protein K2Q25_02285 [Mycobacteriaceae bacterium]|nr:hypothetical protein [Mycobacteriaceae bacterium]
MSAPQAVPKNPVSDPQPCIDDYCTDPDTACDAAWKRCEADTAAWNQRNALSAEQELGHRLIDAAHCARTRWQYTTVERLARLVGDEAAYPLLTPLQLGYRVGQILKALGKLLLVCAGGRQPDRRIEPADRVCCTHASPSLGTSTLSVGDGPAPGNELRAHIPGAGHPQGGDAE